MIDSIADILFIEDSLADIAFIKAILKLKKIECSAHFLRDGDDIIEMVKSEDSFLKNIDLIFMDFNLTTCTGLEILSMIKEKDALKHIPVVMLTGSDSPEDMAHAEKLGARGYIVKPLNEAQLKDTISNLPTLNYTSTTEGVYIHKK